MSHQSNSKSLRLSNEKPNIYYCGSCTKNFTLSKAFNDHLRKNNHVKKVETVENAIIEPDVVNEGK